MKNNWFQLKSPMPTEEGELSAEASMATLTQYLWSIIFMPNSMKVLCLTNLFCWMSLVCYSLYFTDFVGEAVFKGNPAVSTRVNIEKRYSKKSLLLRSKTTLILNNNSIYWTGRPRKQRAKIIWRGSAIWLLGNGNVLTFLLMLLIHHWKAC